MGKTTLMGLMTVALVFALAPGCQQQRRGETVLVQSDVLVEATARTLAQAMMAREEAGEDVPEGYETEEFAESVIDSLLMQHPNVFTVTQEDEQRMREGRFDDEANAVAAEQMVAQVGAYDVPLDTLTSYLVTRLEAGELYGAQLELAARMLSAHLSAALAEEDLPPLEDAIDDEVEDPDFEELGAEEVDAENADD